MGTVSQTPAAPENTGNLLPGGAIPGAAQYLQDNLNAKQAYQNALAKINQQRQNTLLQYGYQGTVDPKTGVISKVGVNPNAPYGLYQQMLRGGAQQGYQQQWGLQDRGVAGGLANQVNRTLGYQFGQDSAKLGQDLSGQLFSLQDQQDQAKYQYDQTLAMEEAMAAMNATNNSDYNTAPPDPNYVPPADQSQQTQASAVQSAQTALARAVVARIQRNAMGPGRGTAVHYQYGYGGRI